MRNFFKKDFVFLFFLYALLATFIFITFAKHGNFLFDNGREAYIAWQVAQGKLLFKDILIIYPPLSYLINGFLFKFINTNLYTLYCAGIFVSFLITTFIYLLSKMFLNRFFAFSLSVFTIIVGISNINLFNFIFPYSYGILYAFAGFLISLFCLIKYSRIRNIYWLYAASFVAGFAVTNKYEFIPYFFVIVYSIFRIQKLRFKHYFLTFLSFISIPSITLFYLISKGIDFNLILNNFELIKNISQSSTLKYFYSTQGVIFAKQTPMFLLKNFLQTSFALMLLLFGVKFNIQDYNKPLKILSIGVIALSVYFITLWANPSSFAFLPILLTVFFIIMELKQNLLVEEKILILSSICLSLKTFFGTATLNYGVFAISVLLLATSTIICRKNIKNINPLAIYILIFATIFTSQNFKTYLSKPFEIETKNGKVFTEKEIGLSTNQLIKYIDLYTKKTDKILILPEGLMINFLTQRNSDNTYYSLIPLYVETFNEEKIINDINKNKPDFIIFSNSNTKDYYFKYICEDYAFDLCNYVAKNYRIKELIDYNFRYLIYEKQHK